MATRLLPSRAPYVVNALTKHTATVIFLHGLGDTGAGWLPVAEMIKTELPHVKWVLPNAPNRPITINGGVSMPGWFDLPSLDLEVRQEDRDGMFDSARTVDKLIEDEIAAGIPSERVVVGGFSQGGVLSLLTGLTDRGQGGWKLGGVVVLSAWMPLRDEFPKMLSPHLTTTPVLMCHGIADPLVRFDWGKATSKILVNLGLASLSEGKLGEPGLSFRSYEGVGHSACDQEIKDLTQFLRRVLPRD